MVLAIPCQCHCLSTVLQNALRLMNIGIKLAHIRLNFQSFSNNNIRCAYWLEGMFCKPINITSKKVHQHTLNSTTQQKTIPDSIYRGILHRFLEVLLIQFIVSGSLLLLGVMAMLMMDDHFIEGIKKDKGYLRANKEFRLN
jgi:hypothetical protein